MSDTRLIMGGIRHVFGLGCAPSPGIPLPPFDVGDPTNSAGEVFRVAGKPHMQRGISDLQAIEGR